MHAVLRRAVRRGHWCVEPKLHRQLSVGTVLPWRCDRVYSVSRGVRGQRHRTVVGVVQRRVCRGDVLDRRRVVLQQLQRGVLRRRHGTDGRELLGAVSAGVRVPDLRDDEQYVGSVSSGVCVSRGHGQCDRAAVPRRYVRHRWFECVWQL